MLQLHRRKLYRSGQWGEMCLCPVYFLLPAIGTPQSPIDFVGEEEQVLVCEDVHHLIHATNPDIIRKYMEILNLDQKQKEKLNKLRSLVHVESY